MRQDMSKVLIERPRGGGVRPIRGRPLPLELQPAWQPVSMGRGNKFFRDLLGPLERFLRSRVGKPWDRVYGEIRSRLSPRSTVHMHVLLHLDFMVAKHVVLVDGRPHNVVGGTPLGSRYRQEFYVCPETGDLRLSGVLPRRGRRSRRRRGEVLLASSAQRRPERGRRIHRRHRRPGRPGRR